MSDFDLEHVRSSALRALGPIRPANSNTAAHPQFLLNARKAKSGRDLPQYYLVYFLLVKLLGFKDLGRFEKIDWSIPIDFKGRAYLVEHGKFGLSLLAHSPDEEAEEASDIANRLRKGVKAARPYFDRLAYQAVERSEINVKNNSMYLQRRYEFLRSEHESKCESINALKEERRSARGQLQLSIGSFVMSPVSSMSEEANWLAISAIEAFFSWTEHVLIHVAIFMCNISTAHQVADLAASEWSQKFKSVFDISLRAEKNLFDQCMTIRQELRNFIAHGAFGKRGEAFSFHSSAGAVPVILPHKVGSKKFSLGERLEFDTAAAFTVLDTFKVMLWSTARAPARVYIEDGQLPTILTFAVDGTYAEGMLSVESMEKLVEHLCNLSDQAANMDW